MSLRQERDNPPVVSRAQLRLNSRGEGCAVQGVLRSLRGVKDCTRENLDTLQRAAGLVLSMPWPGVTNTFSTRTHKCGCPFTAVPCYPEQGTSCPATRPPEGWNAASKVSELLAAHGCLQNWPPPVNSRLAGGQAQASACVSSR